jgi:pimeloyl-ACP methyl ester carboxylesterase
VRERIESELAARGVRSCVIVGHSGGTYRALAVALAGQVHVEAMVLLGAVAGFDDALRAQYEGLSVAVRGGADLRPMYRETATAPGFAARHPERMAEILSAVDACTAAVLADEFKAFASGEDLRPRLGDITSPTLLLVGEHDRITPPAWSEEIAAKMPAARVQRLAGCGHCTLQEDEAGVIEAVRSFLTLPTPLG